MLGTIESPCIGICEYAELTKEDIERICRGCGRTTEEITEWYHATEERRKEIIQAAKERQVR